MGYPVGEREELLGFYPTCQLVCLFLWMLACVCHLCFVCLEFLSLKMGNVATVPKEGSLRCILGKGSDYSYEPMCQRKMIFCYNSV